MIRITIACPAAHVAAANQLARCIGADKADEATFGASVWQDRNGSRHAVASMQVDTTFLETVLAQLREPRWGADLAAAGAAQARIVLFDPDGMDPETPRPDMAARPDRITAIIHDDPLITMAWLGLAPAE